MVLLVSLGAASAVRADPALDERSWAEALVRTRYYEGMPFDAPQRLESVGIERLAEMLDDPGDEKYRSNIVMALGLSRHPEAFAVLEEYARRRPRGRVSREVMNARLSLPVALGHLSRFDARAYALLEQRVRDHDQISWSQKRFSSDRLREMLYQTRIQAIGVSGKVEGIQFIQSLIPHTQDHKRRNIMHDALDLSDRVRSIGAMRVFGGERAR